MNNLDFIPQGYQIKRELGKGVKNGRCTYLGVQVKTNTPVIIKQFQFAESGASWSEYEAHQREIDIVKQLYHPLIPHYLDQFETPQGYCLVEEHISAFPLMQLGQFTWQEIKEIALGVLEILVYLQSQYPPIFHSNIQPKNILVNRSGLLKVYLVNFDSAYQGYEKRENRVRENSGFFSPEQILGNSCNKTTDLYSLGATLICLLTNTQPQDLGKLFDEKYQFNFKFLPPQLSPRFINWLKKMVAPHPKNRFHDAAAALKALKPILIAENTKKFKQLIHVFAGVTSLIIAATLSNNFGTSSLDLGYTKKNLNFDTNPMLESPVKQLLKRGECFNCNLRGVDLRAVDLPGAVLFLANLENANLQGANLPGSYLKVTNLYNAQLQGINLQGAFLEKANLHRASLHGANLQGANLTLTNFQEADLQGAFLQRTSLQDSNFQGANLRGASLTGADLRYANLSYAFSDGVDFQNANLEYSNFDFAYLNYANFQGANLANSSLQNVNLRGANLQGANLRNANLRNADLTDVNLDQADLEGAIMPDGSRYIIIKFH